MIQRYRINFTLHAHGPTFKDIKNAFAEFAQELSIEEAPEQADGAKDFKVGLVSDEPTSIFDICAQLGRIRQIKVDEIERS